MQTSPSSSNPGRLSDRQRRAQLLAFGRRHFARSAFDAAPMHAIAAAAGVSKGLLYHHFGGRRGFYLATVEDVIDGLLAAIELPSDLDPASALRSLVEGFVGYAADNADIYQALVRGGLGADAEVGAQLDRVRDHASRVLVERFGAAPLSPLQRVQLVGWMAWVEAATSAWLDAPEVPVADFVAAVLDTLAGGVARLFAEARP